MLRTLVLQAFIRRAYREVMTDEPRRRALVKCEDLERIHAILGKRWMGLIVDTLRQRPARFNELAATLSISRRMLSARLKELISIDVVARTDENGEITYALTSAGHELGPSLDVMRTWSAKHLAQAGD